ncbi:MAG: enoyl-CoA hydratase [Deltaproteobacteria bacterium]|nr:enoyl-CoA hydratase [Deltaproteobacteria bacterium]
MSEDTPASPAPSPVLYAVDGGIARITLNRPEARNALSAALMRELTGAFERAGADPEVRVVILTGAGKAFCAGVDLKESATVPGEAVAPGERPAVWRAMEACRRPIIGAINGAAITGGFELALACDVLVASTNARFADTHARVGVIPGAGLSQRLSRAIGIYRAKYLSLTGNFLSAQQAYDWGLVSHVVAPEQLEETTLVVAKDMLSVLPHMLEPYKALIDEGFAREFGPALSLESKRSAAHIEAMGAWAGARGAFEAVRERGRGQQG